MDAENKEQKQRLAEAVFKGLYAVYYMVRSPGSGIDAVHPGYA